MTIDDVLKPYENDQPKQLSVIPNNVEKSLNVIERMPRLADMNGITREFQMFYDELVHNILTHNLQGLYDMSDKAVDYEEFCEVYTSTVGKHISDVISLDKKYRGIDIELNMSRFEGIHRNTVGGFFIMMYTLIPSNYEGLNTIQSEFNQEHTEILFTYKSGKFTILSHFQPFMLT